MKASVLVIGVAAIIGFTVQTGAFSTLESGRSAEVGAASDQNALVGLDITDSLTAGGGGAEVSCDFGTNDLVVDKHRSDDVDTNRDVIVKGNSVEVDIKTTGCIRVESGARLNGDADADGNVIVENGGRLTGDVTAGGDVTIQSGGRINGDVSAGGDVTVEHGGRSRLSGDVDACGDITAENGARIDGDASAGGTITVENGARINGDVEENADIEDCGSGRQRLLGVTNRLNSDATVTVTLQDPNDGTLFAGSDSGDSVQFTLATGASQDVSIELSDSPGSSVGFEITAESTGGESSVTLQRSVSTTGS